MQLLNGVQSRLIRNVMSWVLLLLVVCAKDVTSQTLTSASLKANLDSLNLPANDSVKSAILLKLGIHYLTLPGEKKAELDSAYHFLQTGLKLSKDLRDRGAHDYFKYHLVRYQFEAGNTEKGLQGFGEEIRKARHHP
ncbi:MAG: hypothetical protein EOO04_39265 [Chitinophagaceae bacterium]|nr:MAG: hypothetical protein EOO04_39265 [Chitinophagaceae bacterium]